MSDEEDRRIAQERGEARAARLWRERGITPDVRWFVAQALDAIRTGRRQREAWRRRVLRDLYGET